MDTKWLNRISPQINTAGSSISELGWVEPPRYIYDHELVLFRATEFVVEINKKIFQCPPDTYIIVPPGTPEQSTITGSQPGWRHWIHFDWEWKAVTPDSPVMTYIPKAPSKNIFRMPPPFIPQGVMSGKIHHPCIIFGLHERIESLCNANTERSKNLARSLFLELLIELFVPEEEIIKSDSITHTYLLNRAQTRLRELAETPLNRTPSLREALSQLGCSYPHLMRLYKKHFGITPIEYITALRIERAKGFLRDTTMTIAEIGYKLGIDNSSYFSRIFQKYTGLSPTSFRKQY
jgi:AraC-like DNA-binding protein